MSHQHSPSLKVGLMALRGMSVCIFSTKEPKDKHSKIFVVKVFIERHVPHICSSFTQVQAEQEARAELRTWSFPWETSWGLIVCKPHRQP